MTGRLKAPFLVLLLLCTSVLAGCVSDSESAEEADTTTADQKQLPVWEIGDNWLYTFITPQFGEDSARLVVAEIDPDEGNYQLGISSEREAQRHAVTNHNPFLGRMTIDGLSVYENGEPQQVFAFPWSIGQQWSFTLFEQSGPLQQIRSQMVTFVSVLSLLKVTN